MAASAAGADVFAGPDTYLPALARLQPGDTLWLAPGDYRRGLPLHKLKGLPGQPIRVRGRPSADRPRFLARPGHNTVSIADAEHLEIAGLDLDGQGLPVDAVKAEGSARFAHYITLEGLRIFGHNAHQQNVGISTKCPAAYWVVRSNEIAGAGTGMYFGNSDGSAPFVAGLIEGNVVRDTIGYSLQIKHQKPRPAGVGLPPGPSVTVIRHNTFSKASGGATAELARPNVLVGHWPPSGEGRDDTYLVYGNLFFANPTEALFQGEGHVALYSNLFFNPVGPAVRIHPHNGTPDRIDVFFNTVIAASDGIRVTGGNPAFQQQVWGNAIVAATPPEGWDPRDNLAALPAEAGPLFERLEAVIDRLDPRLTALARLPARQDRQPQAPTADGQQDLCGRPRAGVVAGALAAGAPAPRFAVMFEPGLLPRRCP